MIQIQEKSNSTLITEIGVYNNSIRKTMEKFNMEVFFGRAFGFHVIFLFETNFSSVLLNSKISATVERRRKNKILEFDWSNFR